MTTVELVTRGREAYTRLAWGEAYTQLSAATAQGEMDAADLERLAMAAYLTGRADECPEAFEQAHRSHLAEGDVARAVRCAFWLGVTLLQGGQQARGGGWIGRAQRLLDESSLDCVERGYLVVPGALQALFGGDPEAALRAFDLVTAIADRFDDRDLEALGRLGRGHALIRSGDPARGVGMLDEAMVAVTTGEVSAIVAGMLYCLVIIACRDIFDMRRAEEWTGELSRWCAAQQDLRPFRGQCLVHRSEIMQLRGEWPDAMREMQRACEHLSDPAGDPVLGMAQYQRGELLRLRGELGGAEEAYRQASRWGHPVQPGLALLRLAQGRVEDAEAAIRRVLQEAQTSVERSRVLAPYVEIVLAVGDVESAERAAEELDRISVEFHSSYLQAVAGYARGAVLLATGDAGAACVALRGAWHAWQELEAPYEMARARLLLAKACQQLGDHDTAEMELDAARSVFEQLGAAPALAAVAELSGASRAEATPGGLTAREVEVLRLVASGATNRHIADTLVISEKTVARHLTNTYNKLGVSSRAAATAYAYEHHLV